MIRPGPDRLPLASCPGGIIIHMYGTGDGRFLSATVLPPWADVAAEARHAVDVVQGLLGEGENICLVFFDGDSGNRVLPPGYKTGDIV